MFDPNKPVQTRDGRSARIVSTKLDDPNYTIGALVTQDGGLESFEYYQDDGSYDHSSIRPHGSDLVNIGERYETFYNVYPRSLNGRPGARILRTDPKATVEEADSVAEDDRIGLLRLVMEDGRLRKAELV